MKSTRNCAEWQRIFLKRRGFRSLEQTGQEWDRYIEPFIKNAQIDLAATARETKALQRKRGIGSAQDLLRLILFIAMSNWSFRLAGAWALVSEIGSLSDVAILHRLRKSRAWLERLVTEMVAQRVCEMRERSDFRIEIRDATTLNAPASQGTNWRLHLGYDIATMSMTGIDLTDQHGGENFGRFSGDVDELEIGDGGYAFKSSLMAPLSSGSWVLARTNWQNISAFEENGERFKILPWLKTIHTISEKRIEIKTSLGHYNLRLIAAPIPPEKAALARQKIRKRNSKKQNHVKPATIFAAGFVIVLTNLPSDNFPAGRVMSLYRLRWQIELAIKRQKSLMNFDSLRVKNPEAAQAFILAKLLIALLVEDMISQVTLQKPDWFASLYRPVSLSRLTILMYQAVCRTIAGPWHRWLFVYWDDLQRFIQDTPRNRPQQLAVGRAFVSYLSALGCFSLC